MRLVAAIERQVENLEHALELAPAEFDDVTERLIRIEGKVDWLIGRLGPLLDGAEAFMQGPMGKMMAGKARKRLEALEEEG